MIKVTWDFFERLGIPDTRMRSVMLTLAEIIAAPGSGQIALAAVAYRALLAEYEEMYAPKSPLQQQLEYIRVHKELEALLGTTLPTMDGEGVRP